MNWKNALLAAAVLAILAAAPRTGIVATAQAGCEAGDRIDGSTMDGAKKRMESAGFRGVRELKKGCDNFWHAMATKDGTESRVLLTPKGDVTRDGD